MSSCYMSSCFYLALYFMTVAVCVRTAASSKVLLVSMDGFRWDYPDRWDTPNFDKLAEQGVRAPFINNTFITKTFPGHYSLATGLYEESHGIVGNRMYDPEFNDTFRLGNFETRWWNAGEPIWITARKQGLKSATFFWPGSEVEIKGSRPNLYRIYDKNIPFKERIDTVVGWLKNDTDIAVMYFHEPDATAHKYGPGAEETRAKVEEMDGILGDLLGKLRNESLIDEVNIIVTSDHGMAEVDFTNKVVDISYVLNMETDVDRIVDFGPIMHIDPRPTLKRQVYDKLRSLQNIDVYLKEDIPDFWHYRNNRRIMPILAVAKEGWSIVKNATKAASIKDRGNHGYDNRLMSMKPIFYARGPNFKKNYRATPFESVDVYQMICSIMGISSSPNNGSLGRVQEFLVLNSDSGNSAEMTGRPISVLTSLFSLQISLSFIFS